MYELIRAGEKTYYIDCPAKIGVYKATDSDVYIIDSGSDKDAGKKVKRILDENGWKLRGIITTHSNADHIGGNKYLQQQTGCKIFAGRMEKAFTEDPILSPSFLYGGFPGSDLRHKFILAQESTVCDLDDPDFPKELTVLPLPGHFLNMIGILAPDGTAFMADCVASERTLEKYRIPFIYDVEKYLATLEQIKTVKAKLFVPAHCEATADISALADANRANVAETCAEIKKLLKNRMSFEVLLKNIFDEYGLCMTFEQNVLVGSTVRSFLSYLKDKGEIGAVIEDNMLLYYCG